MPVIAQFIVGVDLVEVLRDTISECGCVSLLTESDRLNIPAENVRSILQDMDGVSCVEDNCCITDLTAFSEKMKKLSGEE